MVKCTVAIPRFLKAWSAYHIFFYSKTSNVEAWHPRDPRSRQMGARFQPRMIPTSVKPAKDVRTHPPTVLSVIALMIDLLFFESESLPPSLREGPFIVSEVLPPFNGGTNFWLVMMALR